VESPHRFIVHRKGVRYVLSFGTPGFHACQQEYALSPIYLPSYTPVQRPQARRFANNYTRLFIRYPGLEDSKLGA
jgi:hypothetical protein